MHEVGLCEAIVEAALRRAGSREVSAVRVRVGGHPVDEAVIQQGFQLAAMGTVAEHATLDLVREPMLSRCHGCGAESPALDAPHLAACPACGGVDVDVIGDEDVVLESITVRAPAHEATRPLPAAPTEPPALALAAPLAAIYDRMRDRLQGRPKT